MAGNRSHDSSPDIGCHFFTVPWRLLRGIWKGSESQNRRSAVARLRADILPEEPDTKICPMCLRLFFPDELRG